MRVALLATLLVVAPVAACAGREARSPESALNAFRAAVREGRHADAYALLSRSYRQRIAFEEFERHLTAHPAETKDLVAVLGELEAPIEVTASVPTRDGELRLIREDGAWKLSENVVDFYDQSTPRATIRSFVRAMERRRYDVVLRFVPRADLEGMTVERMQSAWEGENREEIERLLANLRAHIENPIEVVGDRATMPYGERFTVQLIREGGVWKIEDPD